MKKKPSPAEFVLSVLGGVRPVARALGLHASTVSRWKRGDGHVPQKHWPDLMAIAKKQKVKLSVDVLSGIAA